MIGIDSNIKGLLDQCFTARALLRCVVRVNQYDHTTSVLGFVPDEMIAFCKDTDRGFALEYLCSTSGCPPHPEDEHFIFSCLYLCPGAKNIVLVQLSRYITHDRKEIGKIYTRAYIALNFDLPILTGSWALNNKWQNKHGIHSIL
jgi:hypothetical protein